MTEINDDPFSPEADPDRHLQRIPARNVEPEAHECGCAFNKPVSRRMVLMGAGALAAAPMVSAAAPFAVPCVQDKQKVNPCKHKFCRNYAGKGDYYQR